MEISATTSLTFPKTQSLSSFNSSFFNNGGTHLLKTNKRTNCLVLRKRRNRPQRSGFNITCLFGLGVPELAVIAGVAALVFGPKKLPEVGKSLGKTIKSFQQAAKEFESELKKEPETAIKSPTENPTPVSQEGKQDTKSSTTGES